MRFAQEGAELILVGRSRESLADVDRAVCSRGGQAVLAVADLAHVREFEDIAGAVRQRCGRLDVLVGNAGVLGPTSAVVDISPDIWDDVLAVNLTANWRLL
ncbi:MAG: SDR family NAD(P)-dependent oxidoreductase, partial [Rhodospirillales bacterium]